MAKKVVPDNCVGKICVTTKKLRYVGCVLSENGKPVLNGMKLAENLLGLSKIKFVKLDRIFSSVNEIAKNKPWIASLTVFLLYVRIIFSKAHFAKLDGN